MLKWNPDVLVPRGPSRLSIKTIIAIAIAIAIGGGAWFFLNTLPPVTTPPVVETPVAPAPPVPPVVEVPPPPPPPPPPDIPSNFIIPDEVWQNAFLLNRADGSPLHRGVGFSEIPIGTKVYAPMDGRYVHSFEGVGGGHHTIVLAKKDWKPKPKGVNQDIGIIDFTAKSINVLNWTPQKGEVFAVIEDNKELFPGFYDREVVLIVRVDALSTTPGDRTITDPRAYLWITIQSLSTK